MSLPPDVYCLADYEQLARESLSPADAAYLFGGAADELTVDHNRAAFDQTMLVPRVLRDLSQLSTACTLFGADYAAPIMLAPVAYQRLYHPRGEIDSARAAAAMGVGYCLSTLASSPLEDVANAGEGAPQWFQLYMQPTREATEALVRRAEAYLYRAIVVTVDAPINGVRNREMQARFRLPDHVAAVNLASARGENDASLAPDGLAALVRHAPTWQDIAWLRDRTRLPILIKGILHPDDASTAIAHGADGIIVSNHGGRVLDTAIASLRALPAVVRAVDGRVPVLLDGGVRRGTDIVKALALGARAVLVGRPYVSALAIAGAHGVAHAIRILQDEFAVALALTGCSRPDQCAPDLLASARE